MSSQPLSRQVLSAMLAIAGLLGVGFFGFQLGQSGKEKAVGEAWAAGKAEAEDEAASKQQFQTDLIRLFVEFTSDPTVEAALPEEVRRTVEEAADAIGTGDIEAATQLLPGAIASLDRDCVPEGQSVAVAPGTPVQTCNAYGTKALIGQILNADTQVRVTVDGQPDNIGFGSVYSGTESSCDVLIEKRDTIDGNDVIWTSFAC